LQRHNFFVIANKTPNRNDDIHSFIVPISSQYIKFELNVDFLLLTAPGKIHSHDDRELKRQKRTMKEE